jgi:CTP:molybdopterin cytidylyltransferase MocA
MIPIVILASGKSSRMSGHDKLMREIDGVPMLVRCVRMAAATKHQVFATIPGPSHARYAALKKEPVTCFDVPESAEGIGGTLRGVVRRLPPCSGFMIVLADLPELETRDLVSVIEAQQQFPENLIWCGSTKDGRIGHPILFDAALRKEFATLKGDIGAKSIIQKRIDFLHCVPLEGDRSLRDVDTEDDWNRVVLKENALE